MIVHDACETELKERHHPEQPHSHRRLFEVVSDDDASRLPKRRYQKKVNVAKFVDDRMQRCTRRDDRLLVVPRTLCLSESSLAKCRGSGTCRAARFCERRARWCYYWSAVYPLSLQSYCTNPGTRRSGLDSGNDCDCRGLVAEPARFGLIPPRC